MNLEVIPLTGARSDHVLVVFETAGQIKGKRQFGNPPAASRGRGADERVTNLTRELEASREYLQSTIPELEAANDVGVRFVIPEQGSRWHFK